MLPVIAITMGDPAGVGPELCLRVLRSAAVAKECVPVVFGDAGVLGLVAGACGLPGPERVVAPADWSREVGVAPASATLVDLSAVPADQVQPGRIQVACGRAAHAYIVAAIAAAMDRKVAAVATCPIYKEALRLAGIDFPGHTEIFAARTGAGRTCMMLGCEELAVSFVTTHVAHAEVPALLTPRRILDVIELTAEAVGRMFGRERRVAVCGLNPHAGEHGLFGSEEQRVIAPAIASARERGIDAVGPLSPDSAFLPAGRGEFRAVVCMYHDQGHIPFKMLAFDRGVNVTLGLPIIRTSVDHGTAFDIAWTGRASATSLTQAVLWAARMASGRCVLDGAKT